MIFRAFFNAFASIALEHFSPKIRRFCSRVQRRRLIKPFVQSFNRHSSHQDIKRSATQCPSRKGTEAIAA